MFILHLPRFVYTVKQLKWTSTYFWYGTRRFADFFSPFFFSHYFFFLNPPYWIQYIYKTVYFIENLLIWLFTINTWTNYLISYIKKNKSVTSFRKMCKKKENKVGQIEILSHLKWKIIIPFGIHHIANLEWHQTVDQ